MRFSPDDVLVLVAILAAAVVILVWVTSWVPGASRPTRAQLALAQEYRSLAEEFRRLSEMGITAQEHVDLRLTDLSVRVDAIKDDLAQMQRILREVE
jgi:hypothetical protein